MREITFGIIGCGLMGREFAWRSPRWCHLLDLDFKPRIAGICDTNPALFGWFQQNFATIKLVDERTTTSCCEPQDVDAIYCAVPHNLHAAALRRHHRARASICSARSRSASTCPPRPQIIDDDQGATRRRSCAARRSSRSSRRAQRIVAAIQENRFGRIIEVELRASAFSSDLDPEQADQLEAA